MKRENGNTKPKKHISVLTEPTDQGRQRPAPGNKRTGQKTGAERATDFSKDKGQEW